ncbi:MAG: hypothetical protein R6V08_07885 [Desulfuromonadales bacterium]
MIIKRPVFPLAVVSLVMLVLICGCASSTAKRSDELLLKDYQSMSDDELETYYFRLNDQIARVERKTRDTNVGEGIGNSPVKVTTSTGVEEVPMSQALRDRRNEVRQELSRRGLRE